LLACERCSLHRFATQAVPGEGVPEARLMLIGEQPGDEEDLTGRPFVGPAGRLLDELLAASGIDRGTAYLTNAVKHFRFEVRGKRRMHQRPGSEHIVSCGWWLQKELALVRPEVVVALGATAARSLLGRTVTITALRGRMLQLADGTAALVTVHPSFLLRIEDDADKQREYDKLVADLRPAARMLAKTVA